MATIISPYGSWKSPITAEIVAGGEIGLEQIRIEPSNLSQQLAVLRRTSLVVARRQGGEVTYSISAPEVRDLLLSARRILVGLIHVDEDHDLAPATTTDR